MLKQTYGMQWVKHRSMNGSGGSEGRMSIKNYEFSRIPYSGRNDENIASVHDKICEDC